jgi:hypothetical protein
MQYTTTQHNSMSETNINLMNKSFIQIMIDSGLIKSGLTVDQIIHTLAITPNPSQGFPWWTKKHTNTQQQPEHVVDPPQNGLHRPICWLPCDTFIAPTNVKVPSKKTIIDPIFKAHVKMRVGSAALQATRASAYANKCMVDSIAAVEILNVFGSYESEDHDYNMVSGEESSDSD